MGCNAYNHPPDCNCGWGGEHYDPAQPDYGPDYWEQESSHTNPNARCPVCGAGVFFYRSPDGGAVYFDRLGPPWPKHPCTDQAASSRLSGASVRKPGWWPFLADFRGPLPGREGSFLSDAQGRVLLVKSRYLEPNTPIWVTGVKDQRGVYRLSTLRNHKGKTVEATYAAYSAEALAQPEHAIKFQTTLELLEAISQRKAGVNGLSTTGST